MRSCPPVWAERCLGSVRRPHAALFWSGSTTPKDPQLHSMRGQCRGPRITSRIRLTGVPRSVSSYFDHLPLLCISSIGRHRIETNSTCWRAGSLRPGQPACADRNTGAETPAEKMVSSLRLLAAAMQALRNHVATSTLAGLPSTLCVLESWWHISPGPAHHARRGPAGLATSGRTGCPPPTPRRAHPCRSLQVPAGPCRCWPGRRSAAPVRLKLCCDFGSRWWEVCRRTAQLNLGDHGGLRNLL